MGRRIVTVEKLPFLIGRRVGSDLHLPSGEISRDHAEIVTAEGGYAIRDRGSRYGTFVNDDSVQEGPLAHGDRIRLGRSGGAEMTFLLSDATAPATDRSSDAVGDLRQVAALLEGLRAVGSARVLDDVLRLVMDSSIAVSSAERVFIMLANPEGELEFKMGRSRDRATLPGSGFETSRKIPEEVFRTGQTRIEADLLDGDLAANHMGTIALGIRHVLCVPLRLVRYTDEDTAPSEERQVGVLSRQPREGHVDGLVDRQRARDPGERGGGGDREREAVSDGAGEGPARAGNVHCRGDSAGAAADAPADGAVLRSGGRNVRSAAISSSTSTCRRAGSGSRSVTWPGRGRRRHCSAR